MEQSSRIYLWDNLKVLLMVMVVITHCVNVYQLQGERWIQFYWILIMTFTMPLFTLISGFFYKERTIRYSIERFLYPCIIFSILNYAIGIPSGAYPNGISPKTGWAMWYLWALFVYNIITPYFLKIISEKKLLILSFGGALICGFKFIPNEYLDSCRVVFFFPFFVLGFCLKKNNLQIGCKSGFVFMFFSLVAYCLLTAKFYGFPYGTGFMGTHGMNLFAFGARWANYILTIVMSISLIAIMPNKKYWFTKFGTRTMNVYLLHMAIVFPVCWYLLRPYMHYWYGYILYAVVVPSIIVVLLFSDFVDRNMQFVLSLPKRLFQGTVEK